MLGAAVAQDVVQRVEGLVARFPGIDLGDQDGVLARPGLDEGPPVPVVDGRAALEQEVLPRARFPAGAVGEHRDGAILAAGGGAPYEPQELVRAWEKLLADAHPVEEPGAFAVVLEAVPRQLAKRVTSELSIPTIGIGAGPDCDGQVLVLHDMLGMFDRFTPKFVKRYANLKADAVKAIQKYKKEVETGKFPSDKESFH